MNLESLATIRLSNHSLRVMRSSIEAEGLDWAPLLAEAQIPASLVDDPHGEVSGVQELRLQEVFAEATRHIPGAWFRTGLRYRAMSYGPLGLAVLAADTFEAGLQVMTSFQALHYSLIQYKLVYDDGGLVAVVADDSLAAPAFREFCQERCLGAAMSFFTDMSPGLAPVLRIESVLEPAPARMTWVDMLGVPVAFGAPATRWILKPEAAKTPLPMASPLLEETYKGLCARLIHAARVNDDMVSQLYELLIRSGRRPPSAAGAARQLAVSERTLHRRLAHRRLSFGTVLDQVREQRATYLLDNSPLSIERVAESLGFAETASFSRAFRRWKGLSPLQFRRRADRPTSITH